MAEQQPGEPDPAGEQWVDYVPPIEVLGPGRYAVSASYRWSSGRASYPAIYRVHHALGTNEVPRDQRLGTAGFVMIYFNLGEFELRPGSLVRVEDPGSESITFGNMRFKLLAPVPRLDVALRDGWCELRWPTNATDYRLECTDRLNLPESAGWPAEPPSAWQPVNEPVATQGDRFQVFVPLWERAKYFRLAR